MSKLVSLAKLQFEVPPTPARDIGQPGYFAWVPLCKLRVDESYQRPIEAAGKKNIRRIVEEFHWTKFGPLIVSPRHGDVFAIIDGQHHAVAALIHGAIPEAPCWVLTCTPEEEARAFSTINGIVTRVHPQYLFRARIASGDAGAVAADEAARAAGAVILPYPQASHQMKVGQTLAGRTIEIALGRYGREPVVTALQLITRTGDGNPGMVKGDIIEGFADCLFSHPKWLSLKDGVRLSVEARGLRVIYADAVKRSMNQGGTMKSRASTCLAELLHDRHGDGGKAAGTAKTLGVQSREQARRDHEQSRPASAPPPSAPKPAPPPPVAAVQQRSPSVPAAPPVPRKRYPAVVHQHVTLAASAQQQPDRVGVDLDQNGRLKITTYLIRKGHMASAQGGGFRIDCRAYDFEEALDLVNEHRAKADLKPLKRSEVV